MIEDVNMEKPIFIVGLPRSGSTLWHNIIVMSPEILRLSEMHFLHPWRKDFRTFYRKNGGDLSSKDVRRMVDLMLSGHQPEGLRGVFWRFENLRSPDDEMLKEKICKQIQKSNRELGIIFKIILEEITRFNGYRRFCVKFPVYVNYIPELLRWYPEGKVIHITRDPRAIAVSKRNDPGGTALLLKKYPRIKFLIRKTMIVFVVIQYIWASRLHKKYRHLKNYALFGYEDLLTNPESVVNDLCKFIGVDYSTEMLELSRGRHEHQPSSVTGERRKNIDKRSAFRWINMITPFEKILITLLTKKSMDRFRYDASKHPIFRV